MFPKRRKKREPARHRPTPDALICSYPKSGRTWLRYMTACYLNRALELGLDLDLQNLFTVLPNDSDEPERGWPAFAFSGKAPLVLSSHKPFNPQQHTAKVIMVVRDPRDVLVSQWMHRRHQHGRFEDDLSTFLDDERFGLAGLSTYLESWAPRMQAEGSLKLTYQAMSEDAQAELRRVVEFLGLPVDEAALALAPEDARFDRMAKVEQERGIAGHRYDVDNPDARRVRKGVVGGYGEHMSEADEAKVRARMATLSPAAQALFDGTAWSA